MNHNTPSFVATFYVMVATFNHTVKYFFVKRNNNGVGQVKNVSEILHLIEFYSSLTGAFFLSATWNGGILE